MVQVALGSRSTTSASSPISRSPFCLKPYRLAGLRLVNSAILFNESPRFRPSLTKAERRYSVPPKPDFASQTFSASSESTLSSCLQQAWSLQIQSIWPFKTLSQRYSTSSLGLIGGFTLAKLPVGVSTSKIKCPMVTSLLKLIWGKTVCICMAASTAFFEVKCNRLILGRLVSLAR